VVLVMMLMGRRRPAPRELAAVGLALIGTWLLIGGPGQSLRTSPVAVAFGLLSAVLLAFYTWFPARLMDQVGTLPVVAWGLVLGGLAMVPVAPPWALAGIRWTPTTVGLVAFVVLVGTLAAFTLYLVAVKTLRPTAASILASAEPLAATLAAVLWLHTPWTWAESLGGVSIVATVMLLARPVKT
jgi:drug/metabolite transporter (DMT)-like permease